MKRRQVALAGHIGDVATARLGLSDPDPAVRATALGAVARLCDLRLEDIVSALADSDAGTRARGAELAAGLGPEGARLLVEALSDEDERVVESASFALGELGEELGGMDATTVGAVVAALSVVVYSHDDPLCREAAVAALGATGQLEGLPAILSATSDKPAVRRRAVLALAPFAGEEVEAALERALHDRDWQVRQAAEDLTGRS